MQNRIGGYSDVGDEGRDALTDASNRYRFQWAKSQSELAVSAGEGECYQTEGEKCKSGCRKGGGNDTISAARNTFDFVTPQILVCLNGKMPIPREA
jgi:hypothetical protein